MCGIVGYIGGANAVNRVVDGLKSLEYRGYDSSGVAFRYEEGLEVVKRVGRLKELEEALKGRQVNSGAAIGHTRWATHGVPSEVNAHPHVNMKNTIAVVHNGIIENYRSLKEDLINNGYEFVSQTDTEIVAMLIDSFYDGNLYEACKKAFSLLEGSFALGVISKDDDEIIATRCSSPLVVGTGDGEYMIASDIPAMLSVTRDFIYLEDYDIVRLSKSGYSIENSGKKVDRDTVHVEWDIESAGKEGYEHFMLKEIYQQKRALSDTINPRIKDGKVDLSESGFSSELFENIDVIYIVACGTAYNAGRTGARFLSGYVDVPIIVDVASEFRYNHFKLDDRTLFIAVSQSGETADTLAALREAKDCGAKTMVITNVLGSSISRECDNVFYTWAGPELAVASTKAYTTQLAAFYLLSLKLGYEKNIIDEVQLSQKIANLKKAVEDMDRVISDSVMLEEVADFIKDTHDLFYIGRGISYDIAMEAALKLKEISYIHTEGFAAGELKHGPIALIEEEVPVIAIITQPLLAEKSLSNVAEVKARGARTIGIVSDSVEVSNGIFEKTIRIPAAEDGLNIFAASAVIQLIAYYTALYKGLDVDRPRNLAKSVTVE